MLALLLSAYIMVEQPLDSAANIFNKQPSRGDDGGTAISIKYSVKCHTPPCLAGFFSVDKPALYNALVY